MRFFSATKNFKDIFDRETVVMGTLLVVYKCAKERF